jgi:foldase protein PrsA
LRKTPAFILATALALTGCGSNTQQASDSTVHKPVEPIDSPKQTMNAPQNAKPDPSPQTSVEAGSNRTIATVEGQPITEQQLVKPLIEGYGLDILLSLGMLQEAKNLAAARGVKVTPDDVKAELGITLKKSFADAKEEEYPTLLTQLLQSQNRTRPEFDLVIETNAYLRKVAEPVTKGRITEEQVSEAFRALYGETVRVRHIELSNMTEVAEAKRRIASGEPFEQVARELSRNERTKNIGGAMRPFSRNAENIPPIFRETAFALKPGEVSDAVQVQGMFHLIKLEESIPPKAVKLEDVKDSLREDLQDKLLQTQIIGLRSQLKQQLRTMRILDPVLAEQFKTKLAAEDGAVNNRQDALKKMEDERISRIRAAATQPATKPTTLPATQPEELRPPATTPAVVPTTGQAK